jgi:hypothetical protein
LTISFPSKKAAAEETAAIHEWLKRERTCLMLGPHHDVGFTDDMNQRQMEYAHHGDALVPRQQCFGQYTRSLMKALAVPVMNQFGLRPALVKGTKQIAPLTINKDVDKLDLLNGVTTFNFHPHLPHYALTTDDTESIHVLTRQPIDLERPHPFTAAGNTEFNSCTWMPPKGDRAGHILQLGLVGYDQWQTTDKSGPTLTPTEVADHYKVYALGFATNLMLPERKASVGIKYFHEFDSRSTFQGYTLQISGAISF